MALVKQYSSSNMETVTKHSTASNTKLIQNEYWNIISVKKTFNISHKILGIHKSYNQSSKRCLLCLNEKLEIALHKDDNMLNKRYDDKVLKDNILKENLRIQSKHAEIRTGKSPQGCNHKRKLFRVNSFVLAHSAVKKITMNN